jgi:hypothetical protein
MVSDQPQPAETVIFLHRSECNGADLASMQERIYYLEVRREEANLAALIERCKEKPPQDFFYASLASSPFKLKSIVEKSATPLNPFTAAQLDSAAVLAKFKREVQHPAVCGKAKSTQKLKA